MNQLILHCPCKKPWARLYNGVLSIDSRHAGRFHTNAISMTLLYSLLRATEQSSDESPLILPAGFRTSRISDHRTRQQVEAIALLCHERDCGRPWAHVYRGRLIVDAWHNGEDHRNEVELMQLQMVAPIGALDIAFR